jgi:hypothetical protein
MATPAAGAVGGAVIARVSLNRGARNAKLAMRRSGASWTRIAWSAVFGARRRDAFRAGSVEPLVALLAPHLERTADVVAVHAQHR